MGSFNWSRLFGSFGFLAVIILLSALLTSMAFTAVPPQPQTLPAAAQPAAGLPPPAP